MKKVCPDLGKSDYQEKTLDVRMRSTESPCTTIVDVGGVIDDHNTSLTPQGIQQGDFQMVTHPVIKLLQQGLT